MTEKWPYWPYTIQFELVQGCNRRCQFCGSMGIDSRIRKADIETARHLFEMVRDAGLTSRILLAGHGEPTLHPEVVEFVRAAREIMPEQTISMFTNGTVIEKRPSLVDELFDAGLNDLNFDEYDDHRVGEFVRDDEKCARYEICELGPGVPLLAPKNPKTQRILITPPIDGEDGNRALTNRCGAGLPPLAKPYEKRCTTVFRDLFVRWDGSVAICCNDFRGEYPVTNIAEHADLKEVYFHERFEAARRLLNVGERSAIHPCRVCDDRPTRVGLLPSTPEPTERDREIASEEMEPLAEIIPREWELATAKAVPKTKPSAIKGDYGSPRWSGEICDCSLPMTMDTYSNCSFGCVYCFSQYQRGIGGGKDDYKAKNVRSVDVERVKRIFTGEQESQFWPFIKARKTIQWGGLSDQFDGYEKMHGVTLELLRFFKEIDYPISFSTKSTWWLDDPRYRELFEGQSNWHCKFSIITTDEKDAARIERFVPSPQERLEAIGKYTDLNAGGATLRLRPFIIGVSSKTYPELIRAAAAQGAISVTTEFFCLERRSVNIARENYAEMSDVIGHDIVRFYTRNSNGQGYLRLNRAVKEPYVKDMQRIAHECGMRFYVSDAHFKEASDSKCCCGIGDEWNLSGNNFAEALQICKRNGIVTFSEVMDGSEWLQFDWGKAEGYNTGSVESRAKYDGMTMRDYLRYTWNHPNRGQAPYTYFEGVMRLVGVDGHGDVIYAWDQERTYVEGGDGGC